jgi:hypothetical protein
MWKQIYKTERGTRIPLTYTVCTIIWKAAYEFNQSLNITNIRKGRAVYM